VTESLTRKSSATADWTEHNIRGQRSEVRNLCGHRAGPPSDGLAVVSQRARSACPPWWANAFGVGRIIWLGRFRERLHDGDTCPRVDLSLKCEASLLEQCLIFPKSTLLSAQAASPYGYRASLTITGAQSPSRRLDPITAGT